MHETTCPNCGTNMKVSEEKYIGIECRCCREDRAVME